MLSFGHLTKADHIWGNSNPCVCFKDDLWLLMGMSFLMFIQLSTDSWSCDCDTFQVDVVTKVPHLGHIDSEMWLKAKTKSRWFH